MAATLGSAAGKYGDKPVEDEMIDEDLHLTLEAGESVFVPFVFLSFNSGSVMKGRGKATAKYSKSSSKVVNSEHFQQPTTNLYQNPHMFH